MEGALRTRGSTHLKKYKKSKKIRSKINIGPILKSQAEQKYIDYGPTNDLKPRERVKILVNQSTYEGH